MAALDEYISGGYFLTKRVPRPQDISDLIPDSVSTVSTCFTDIAPDTWADSAYKHGEDERATEASKFGIPATAVPGLVKLFTCEIPEHHIANAFPNLRVAQEFYRRCRDQVTIILLGIGLHVSLVPSVYAQRHDDVNDGYGLLERIDARRGIDASGEVLGYEPLGYEATKFHSWLCHNAPDKASKLFGIRPNAEGFIESLSDARRVTEHLKSTGAETAIWAPWLILRYKL